jgi:hypothetical protein
MVLDFCLLKKIQLILNMLVFTNLNSNWFWKVILKCQFSKIYIYIFNEFLVVIFKKFTKEEKLIKKFNDENMKKYFFLWKFYMTAILS